MSRPRFVVQTVTGYPFHLPIKPSSGAGSREGLTAHVLDSAYNYANVAAYRSEDRLRGISGGGGSTIGRHGALAAAEALAESLNRATA